MKYIALQWSISPIACVGHGERPRRPHSAEVTDVKNVMEARAPSEHSAPIQAFRNLTFYRGATPVTEERLVDWEHERQGGRDGLHLILGLRYGRMHEGRSWQYLPIMSIV
jgi:hypothetical protein